MGRGRAASAEPGASLIFLLGSTGGTSRKLANSCAARTGKRSHSPERVPPAICQASFLPAPWDQYQTRRRQGRAVIPNLPPTKSDQGPFLCLGREDSNLEMVDWNLRVAVCIHQRRLRIASLRRLSLIRERRPNLFQLKLISNSKRLNFENRTEWAEYRGSEKNRLFGE